MSYCRIAVLFVCAASLALAQTATSIIHGTVADTSGAVIAGATVTATETETQSAYTVVTNADGNYVFPAVRPGRYSVSCELASFRKAVREGVLVEVNQRARVDIALQVGEVREVVSVTADTTTVDTFSATIKEVVDSSRMEKMPLNGRQSLQLQNLLPGAVVTRAGQAASFIALNTGP